MKYLMTALPLALMACGDLDYTAVEAAPGETYVIVGLGAPAGYSVDPMANIMANEACEDGEPVLLSKNARADGRVDYKFECRA